MEDDLVKRAKNAVAAVFVVGGLMVAFGLIAVVFDVQILKALGIGIWSIAEGALFLFLGYLVKKGSTTALWVAIGLYALEVIYALSVIIKLKQPSAVSGMLLRFFILYTMIRGIGAVGQSSPQKFSPTLPTIRPPLQNAPAPRLTGEAEKRRMEMSTLTHSKMEKPAPLPRAFGSRFDVGVKDTVTAAASSLRFVIYRCEISPRGLKATYTNGTTREVEWANVASLVVRQLPPDKPWEGKVVLDILPVSVPGFPVAPLRIFASTYVNYAALPGGQAANTQENIRRLAAHTAAQNPSLILDPLSAPFIQQSKPPHRLTLAQFAEYDQRYAKI